jgi:hypothetical protein
LRRKSGSVNSRLHWIAAVQSADGMNAALFNKHDHDSFSRLKSHEGWESSKSQHPTDQRNSKIQSYNYKDGSAGASPYRGICELRIAIGDLKDG